jgi:hypothetical protein
MLSAAAGELRASLGCDDPGDDDDGESIATMTTEMTTGKAMRRPTSV